VAGIYKVAVASNYMVDAVRFDSQKFNWNLKDFDRYSSAFAFGLVESGYTPGDKVMVWMDQANSAEVLVAIMGAAKAGVTVVTHNEKDNIDSLNQTLKDSGARGLVFSPATEVDSETKETRLSLLKKLMPELDRLYPGDALKVQNYPLLK
jgi:acyl-CoA synthetase (AMP-forming)/AMP-acid ligase II